MKQYELLAFLFCGWVLWIHTTSTFEARAWTIREGYESLAHCDEGIERGLKAFLEPKEDGIKRRVEGKLMFTELSPKNKAVEYFVCLPGATDPRPRFKE